MKTQIILVGGQVLPSYYTIKKFAPDVVHFIATDKTESQAQRLKEAISPSIVGYVHLVDAYRLDTVRQCCEKIHEQGEGEYQYNLTGGTKPMAFAAYRVAIEHHASTLYITAENERLDIDSGSYEPFDIGLSNEEIIRLSGNNVLSRNVIDLLPKGKVQAAKRILYFIRSRYRDHAKLRRKLENYWATDCDVTPRSDVMDDGYSVFEFAEDMQLYIKGGGYLKLIDASGTELFSLNGREDYLLYRGGDWWEVVTLSAAWEIFGGKQELWTNVVFNKVVDTPKNEADLLLNLNSKLLFFECKSGKVDQDDIYRMRSVRDTYGGDISNSILISYYPVDERIIDKCRDANIDVFAPEVVYEAGRKIKELPQYLRRYLIE